MSIDYRQLQRAITEKLHEVIDPETGLDVIAMELVEDLTVDERGVVRYTFHPSSPFCPIAFPLGQAIKEAVTGVPGVSSQEIQVTGHLDADRLEGKLNK